MAPSDREILEAMLNLPGEIAALVCWLSSDECSFTTAGVFDITGGRSTYWSSGSERVS